MSLEESLASIQANFAKRAAERSGTDPETKENNYREESTAEVIQLPLWRDFERAAPACVLRSALFGVVKRGRRGYLKDEVLAAWGNDEIRYQGERLDQADLDVWLELLHFARRTPLGETVRFERYSFLKQVGRSTGRQNWRWLESSVKRMIACAVTIKTGQYRYIGSLIHEGYIDDGTGHYIIVLNERMVELFRASHTLQHAEKRRLLKTDLAKWLAGYVESHRATEEQPHKIGIAKLYDLCGTETKQLRDFKIKLKKASDELQKLRIIKRWGINENGILEVVK